MIWNYGFWLIVSVYALLWLFSIITVINIFPFYLFAMPITYAMYWMVPNEKFDPDSVET